MRLFTPFHFPPRGKGFVPSPLGGRLGRGFYMNIGKAIDFNLKNCYINWKN